ncbi:MAG: N-acetylmuramoyl-L-alanine amidase, partial [Deltaproteobacteria bacterium]
MIVDPTGGGRISSRTYIAGACPDGISPGLACHSAFKPPGQAIRQWIACGAAYCRNRPGIVLALCLLIPFFFLPLTAASAFASNAEVKEVQHWSNPNYTRVVISLGREAGFTSRLLKKDPSINVGWRRLLIDINDARLDSNLSKNIPINDGLLKGVRAGQFDKNTVRIVLDIESIQDYKIFPLSDPYRIVIDVTGDKPVEREKDTDAGGETAAAPPLGRLSAGGIRKIVLDPGHGGKDPGAIGRGGLKEKDVTLRLGRLLKDRLRGKPGLRIIMTRDTDVFIPLEERTAIANREDADLFVSIHINASPKRTASGIETYMLNVSRDEESRRVAARENATSRKAVNDLEFILNDLIKTAKTNDSVRLA